MIRKKVLVHGTLGSLHEFFASKFSREYEPLAVLTDEPEKIVVSVNGGGGRLTLSSRKISLNSLTASSTPLYLPTGLIFKPR